MVVFLGMRMVGVEAMTDDEIDTSDIPPLSEDFFDRATVRMPKTELRSETEKQQDAYTAAKNRHVALLAAAADCGTNGKTTVSSDELHER
ncbi:MAG: hypothetical protein R2856_17945 [Caldilineaceae bacterium]